MALTGETPKIFSKVAKVSPKRESKPYPALDALSCRFKKPNMSRCKPNGANRTRFLATGLISPVCPIIYLSQRFYQSLYYVATWANVVGATGYLER